MELSNLIRESRLTEIATILNILRRHGQEAGFLLKAEDESEITAKDVKYLLNNRKELSKYFILNAPKGAKEKENGY